MIELRHGRSANLKLDSYRRKKDYFYRGTLRDRGLRSLPNFRSAKSPIDLLCLNTNCVDVYPRTNTAASMGPRGMWLSAGCSRFCSGSSFLTEAGRGW